MKQILGGFLTLGICLSPLNIPAVAQATTSQRNQTFLDMGSQGSELLVQAQDTRKAKADQLNEQGTQQFRASQFKAAMESFQKALAVYQSIRDIKGKAKAHNNICNTYLPLGEYQKSINSCKKVITIARQIQDYEIEAKALDSLGIAYYRLGQYDEAIKFHHQSLAIRKKLGNLREQAKSLTNLGLVYGARGKYQQAIEIHQQSLTIKQKLGDILGEAKSIGNIGLIHQSLGQYKRSEKRFKEQLRILNQLESSKQGNPEEQAICLNNLGNNYLYQGKIYDAISKHQEQLEIVKKIGDPQGEAYALNNLANSYRALGKYQDSIRLERQSLNIKREIKDRRGEANSLGNLGLYYRSLGQYRHAVNFHRQHLAIARKIKSPETEAAALQDLGTTFFKSGNLEEAEKSLREAIKVQESLRIELTDLDKVSIFDKQAKTYSLLQQVLVALKKPNAASTALEMSERGRARALVELLATQLYSQSYLTPPKLDDIKQIAKDQNATLVEYSIIYDNFKIQGREQAKESELYSWVIKPTGEVTFRKVDLKPLWQQQETSEPQTSVIDFWQKYLTSWSYSVAIALLIVLGGGCIFIAIRRRRLRRRLLPWFLLAVGSMVGLAGLVGYNKLSQNIATRSGEQPKTALAKLVFSTHETSLKGLRGLAEIASGKTRQSPEERLKQLHQLLIEPIADLLPTEPNARVIFIPQGELFFVPFPALQDESGKHLIEKHTILTAPSIQVLELTRQQRQKLGSRESGVGSSEFMVVGNPTMPKVAPVPGEPPEPLELLPGAEQEAKEIASLLNTQAIIGNQATEAAIVQQMPKARFIHLATHGLLDDLYNADIPGAIALAPSGEDDGLLRASEILKLNLNAELVVLSACDTGQGRITGDGVIGLSRSLFTAGVPSVVASLWKVPDEPTAFLMTNFYKNLQKQPDKAQALRQAMLTTMKKYPNPRNWAAFTLIGEAE